MAMTSIGLRGVLVVFFVLAAAGLPARAADFRITVDNPAARTAPALCLGVDDKAPVVTPPGATIDVPHGAPPLRMAPGTFYPVVLVDCSGAPAAPVAWTTTDTRELRIVVKGEPMCLSRRTPAGFQPLAEPFLAAVGAERPGSLLAYLPAEIRRSRAGVNESAGLPVLASPCARSDAADSWIYDHLTGTVAGPNRQFCLTTDGRPNRTAAPPRAGTPVQLARCGDLRLYSRDATPARQRWAISDPAANWPTYRPPAAASYFGGQAGLPITGPLGRCLGAMPARNVVTTSDCDNRVEQDWLYSDGAIRLGGTSRCLAQPTPGTVLLRPCDGSDAQRWTYEKVDPVPNPRWRTAQVYGRIHPRSAAADCLVVRDDPFLDPLLQNNRVAVAPCAATPPRQTSWFMQDRVRTVRLALLRYANDDGGKPSNGAATDDQMKALMVSFALRLSEHYRGLGLRFVFDPDHDYLALRDSIANEARPRADGRPDWTSANRGSLVAATTLYGRATVVTMAGYGGGGSSGGIAEFEIARMIAPIAMQPETSYTRVPGLPRDRNGLPAVSMTVSEGFVGDTAGTIGHHAHEFGHFFGLGHTFDSSHFADTPDDLNNGDAWEALGTSACGNPRGVVVRGRTITPDRLNNEGYFGCFLGRTRNSFSPLQLGYMDWQLNHFLNRYPLVACQPLGRYEGDQVECENAESLSQCEDSARLLKRLYGVVLGCRPGGRYSRAMADVLKTPAFRFVLAQTPPGRGLVARLAGKPANAPATEADIAAVGALLAACTNLPLTMAVIHRLDDLQAAVQQAAPRLAASAFVAGQAPLSAADRQILTQTAQRVFTPGFIDQVPRMLHN